MEVMAVSVMMAAETVCPLLLLLLSVSVEAD